MDRDWSGHNSWVEQLKERSGRKKNKKMWYDLEQIGEWKLMLTDKDKDSLIEFHFLALFMLYPILLLFLLLEASTNRVSG